MCGIFGSVSNNLINNTHLKTLALHARQRGRDSSGIIYHKHDSYYVKRANYDIKIAK